MARVHVTIDYLDGSSKVHGPLHPDQLDLFGMLMRLSERGIASITFVNADPLREAIREAIKQEQ